MQKIIGTLVNKFNAPVCRMFISAADPRADSYRVHKHIEFEISLVLEGNGIYDTKSGTYDIRPGDIFIYSTNEYHCISDIFPENAEKGMTLLNLHFLPTFVWSTGNDYLTNNYLKIFFNRNKNFTNRLDRDNPAAKKIAEQMLSVKYEFEKKDFDHDVLIKTLIVQLMIAIHRNFGITDENISFMPNQLCERMESALNFIDKNYCSDLSLADIAARAFISKTYFCAMFKDMNGLTPWEYINIKRINKAVDLLRSTELPIMTVALQCGYNNTANFNKIFKQITGSTPRNIRAESRGFH